MPICRDHNQNRLTDRLFSGVAEDSFSTSVPACDYSIEVFAYDCVVAGLNDRGQPIQSFLTFAKRGFDFFDHCNVAVNLNYGVIREQLKPALHNDLATILTD